MRLPTLVRCCAAALAVVCCLSSTAAPTLVQSTMVRLHTTQGPIDLQLDDSQAPQTVANFLAYVRSGAYADTFVHRSVPNFVVQMGGYAWPTSGYSGHIATNPPVVNEFSATRSNLRGTAAMAKLGGDPNSATSEFFFNLTDNSSNLDNQNGGFTVFGRSTAPSMAVVDKIAALASVNAGSTFTNLPVVNFSGQTVRREHVVRLTAVTEFPPLASQSDAERVFNWLEAAYPQYLSPSRGEPGTASGYDFRYYADTKSYIATKDGTIYYLVPSISREIGVLGDLPFWVNYAAQLGY